MARAAAPVAAAGLWRGSACHETTLRELTKVVEEVSKDTADNLAGLSRSVHSLTKVLIDNLLVLDYLLAEQGEICAVINETCCTYVNSSGRVETNIRKIYEQAEWLHKYNQLGQGIRDTLTLTWLLPLLDL